MPEETSAKNVPTPAIHMIEPKQDPKPEPDAEQKAKGKGDKVSDAGKDANTQANPKAATANVDAGDHPAPSDALDSYRARHVDPSDGSLPAASGGNLADKLKSGIRSQADTDAQSIREIAEPAIAALANRLRPYFSKQSAGQGDGAQNRRQVQAGDSVVYHPLHPSKTVPGTYDTVEEEAIFANGVTHEDVLPATVIRTVPGENGKATTQTLAVVTDGGGTVIKRGVEQGSGFGQWDWVDSQTAGAEDGYPNAPNVKAKADEQPVGAV